MARRALSVFTILQSLPGQRSSKSTSPGCLGEMRWPWTCLCGLGKREDVGKGGSKGGAPGKRELGVSRHEIASKRKKIGLPPRRYYPTSSNLFEWGTGGRGTYPKSRHPHPAYFPTERGRWQGPRCPPGCLPGLQLFPNLGCQVHPGTCPSSHLFCGPPPSLPAQERR